MLKEILNTHLLSTQRFTITVGSLVSTFLILVFIYIAIQFIIVYVKKSLRNKKKLDARMLSIIQLTKYLVWTLGIIFALQNLGLDITFLIASSAALLVGIGLGLQNIFKDFMSGIIILIEGTVKVGDIVEFEGLVVRLKSISLRTSEVVTRDDKILLIPNHKFIENNVVNWTYNNAPTRFIIQVGVAYESDIELVKKCILKSADSNREVILSEKYKPIVRLTNFGASSLDFELVFWSENLFRIENTKSDLRFAITQLFRDNNITIPFTQMVIHKTD